MSIFNETVCPKCNGTLEQSKITIKNFWRKYGTDLTFSLTKCSKCDWQNKPSKPKEIRKLLRSKDGFEVSTGHYISEYYWRTHKQII